MSYRNTGCDCGYCGDGIGWEQERLIKLVDAATTPEERLQRKLDVNEWRARQGIGPFYDLTKEPGGDDGTHPHS